MSMKETIEVLRQYAKANLNVLLIGSHGIGKTAINKQLYTELGLKGAYMSAPTLDPMVHFVGIPTIPDSKTGFFELARLAYLDEVEFLFIDELNRAQPMILNAVFELIQFKSIMGRPLPKLKMVWAAINPPADASRPDAPEYYVEPLDPALADRFHAHVVLTGEVTEEYLTGVGVGTSTASVLTSWWMQDLNARERQVITPRRVEYMANMIDKQLAWEYALPFNSGVDLSTLRSRLAGRAVTLPDEITHQYLRENVSQVAKIIEEKPSESVRLLMPIRKMDIPTLLVCLAFIDKMPREQIAIAFSRRTPSWLHECQDKWPRVQAGEAEYSFPRTKELLDAYIPELMKRIEEFEAKQQAEEKAENEVTPEKL